MPSISYTEDSQGQNQEEQHPEPPLNYNPYQNAQHLNPGPQNEPPGQAEMQRLKKYATAAQIMALVSLVFGGVILSSAAVIVAIIGLKGMSDQKQLATDEHAKVAWELLMRSAKVALIISVIALGLNVISLIMFYPIMMDMLQNGDMSQILGGSGSGARGSSVWG